jgi:ABC-type microcin C transport system permease subunit YejE
MDKSIQIPPRRNFFYLNHRAKIRFYEIGWAKKSEKISLKDFRDNRESVFLQLIKVYFFAQYQNHRKLKSDQRSIPVFSHSRIFFPFFEKYVERKTIIDKFAACSALAE